MATRKIYLGLNYPDTLNLDTSVESITSRIYVKLEFADGGGNVLADVFSKGGVEFNRPDGTPSNIDIAYSMDERRKKYEDEMKLPENVNYKCVQMGMSPNFDTFIKILEESNDAKLDYGSFVQIALDMERELENISKHAKKATKTQQYDERCVI